MKVSRIVPVIDLLDGRVVRGVAGRRSEYRPIVSPWSQVADPVEIVRGIREEWGLNEFYVADLDAIQFGRPNGDIYDALKDADTTLMVDAGIGDVSRAVALIEAGVARVILALESMESPSLPRELVEALGADRIVFSLDLMDGQTLSRGMWRSLTPLEVVQTVVDAGIHSLIVLDLAGVGVGQGIPTLPMCREIRQRWPSLEIITGGGVRDAGDIDMALDAGADAALVASALHDGRLAPPALDQTMVPQHNDLP